MVQVLQGERGAWAPACDEHGCRPPSSVEVKVVEQERTSAGTSCCAVCMTLPELSTRSNDVLVTLPKFDYDPSPVPLERMLTCLILNADVVTNGKG